MLGRTGCMSPQVIMSSDGSWFGTLVYIERMTHRSSAHSPIFGKISLTGSPDCPQRLKRNGDIMSPRGAALGAQIRRRRPLPVVADESGLGIERIDLRRPAVHEDVDDPLRLGRKVRQPRRERAGCAGGRLLRGKHFLIAHQGREPDGAEAGTDFLQEVATSEHGYRFSKCFRTSTLKPRSLLLVIG